MKTPDLVTLILLGAALLIYGGLAGSAITIYVEALAHQSKIEGEH